MWTLRRPAHAISSARRLASLTPRVGRLLRGGIRPAGFPPAIEDREQTFERPPSGRVRALGGDRVLGRHDQLQASLARGSHYRGGRARAAPPRSARAVVVVGN